MLRVYLKTVVREVLVEELAPVRKDISNLKVQIASTAPSLTSLHLK
jgi:hypothetical protein